MNNTLYKKFVRPGAEYKGKPFWAWNGLLVQKELLRQIDIMKEMGFGGFFMHSRTGLETEYLGEEWFQLINTCADYAQVHGMEAWLYDEDRWPSGSAGGIVTKEEKYRSSFLTMELYKEENRKDCEWGKLVMAFAVTLNDGILLSERKVKAEDPLLEKEVLIAFYVKESESKEVYNGYTYLDTMQREAVDKYLEVTHEKYGERCGNRLGKNISGIFTDEPHRGALFSSFSEGRENAVPFTPGLFEAFIERMGYDLKEKLPELFFRSGPQGISKTTKDYIELCQELFLENFALPIQRWCKDNHMLFTGHVLHEDSLSAQTVMQGSLMRFYEYMDYPGVDVLSEGNRCYWIVKQVVSVARQLDKKWILSELYGCTGWQMSLADYKYAGDWQALFGITLRCPHLSWYTMKGEAKRDYPASILHQSAWYKEYSYLEDYFSRIHVLMTEGKEECSLLVISPIESVWARAYAGAFESLSARDKEIQRLEQQYAEVFHRLVKRRIDFDYGEEDILSRHGYVQGGILKVGKGMYRKVLVAGMDTMRASTLNLLSEFKRQGGDLIFIGNVPEFIDTIPSQDAIRLAQNALHMEWSKDFESICASGTEICIDGEAGERIYAQSRMLCRGRVVFLLNSDRENTYENLRLDLGIGSRAEIWDAKTGDRTVLQTVQEQGRMICFLNFSKAEEKILMIDYAEEWNEKGENEGLCTDDKIKVYSDDNDQGKKLGQKPKEYSYRLDEENICVLDMVTIVLPDNQILPRQEVLKADRCFRSKFKLPWRSGEMLQPWYEHKNRDSGKVHSVALRYDFSVDVIPSSLVLALEALENVVNISVNGKEIERISTGKWLDICYDKLMIPIETLKTGENILELAVRYEKNSGIEAVYLLGDFGVSLTENNTRANLTKLPKVLRIGDITRQGLPFYSGKISYLTEKAPIGRNAEGKPQKVKNSNIKCTVQLKEFAGSCVKLIGEEEEILAISPLQAELYDLKEIQLICTRRNTFGPLHQLPEKADAYGPDNFMTEGEAWSEAYVLLPQGLLRNPEIELDAAIRRNKD